MQIATRFPIAVHTLLCIDHFSETTRTTSEFIAGSVNVNPVVIRTILQKLKAAGLVEVSRGAGGAKLKRDAKDITLLDIFNAVGAIDGPLFDMHASPNPNCPVGQIVNDSLADRLDEAQKALEANLATTTLADMQVPEPQQ